MTPMHENEARARLQGATPGVRPDGFAEDIIRTGRRRNARDRALGGAAAVAVLGAATAGIFLVNGPTREAVPAQTPTPEPVPTVVPTPTPSATPSASPSSSARPSVAPSATPRPSPSASAPTSAPTWPTVQGEPGGSILVDGKPVGRAADGGTEAFLAAMGTPDEELSSATCGRRELRNTTYRWGNLRVTVLDEEDVDNEYGFAFPPGEVSGWVIDPTLDGRPGVDAPFTGPKGITIGTPLSTLETTFTQDEWDSAGVFEGRFEIFAGDTTGATFDLDADERVSSMSAGYSCG